MAYKFTSDHQPESAEFDDNYSDPRELRRARTFWPDAKPREWRTASVPANLRGNLVKRLFDKIKTS